MGNTHIRPYPRPRNKKQVHWKAAARPSPPGKPQLASETEVTPDLITITWSQPSNDGGSPISGYLVEHRRTGSPHWVRSSPLLVQLTEITISGLEPGWKYQFRVRAENAVGISDSSDLSEPITVTMQRSAVTATQFLQELQDKTVLENEKCAFEVSFIGQPTPKICWFKDAFEIFSSRRIRITTESDKSILTIHQTSLSDEGEIKCTATNRAGHASTKAKLFVEAPPSIRLPRQYEEGLLFEIGEVIRLKVSLSGRPTPLVFWSHDGEFLKNNDRCEIENSDKHTLLKIVEAQRNDRGEYQLKAVNKLGEDIQSFLVTVTDKPSPPGKARVVISLGRSVTLSWTTPNDDGGCKIGNYIIEYYRLGWNVWLKAATSRQLSTILGDLIEGSEYKFRIKAESPYGVSEPSEESDVVFIPDPKRGMLQPQRSRSQQRETVSENQAPVAARRKNKPRSQSSSRAQDYLMFRMNTNNIQNARIPRRPERTKIKTPPVTPEISPMLNRKIVGHQINRNIFDTSVRSSMERELSYGSPDIRVKKDLKIVRSPYNGSSSSERSRSSSPARNFIPTMYTDIIEPTESKTYKSSSPEDPNIKSPKDNTDNFGGSSEFMLVLYPDKNEKGHSDFNFDDYSLPPPMSLSAPELGTEPPPINIIKACVSSTELLHERAFIRFCKAAAKEKEKENEDHDKRKKESQVKQLTEVPKIQINSKDDEDIVGLARKHSFTRSILANDRHQQNWAKRRQSLNTSIELKEELSKYELQKFGIPKNVVRQKLKPKIQEEVLEQARKKIAVQLKLGFKARKIQVADEEKWANDYESSTEDESDFLEDGKKEQDRFVSNRFANSDEDEDEEEIYHPRGLVLDEKPFEILTKKKTLPDPNFVPKPILKKIESEKKVVQKDHFLNTYNINSITKPRSRSPIPESYKPRSRSHSIAESAHVGINKNMFLNNLPNNLRPRSFSLLPQTEPLLKDTVEKINQVQTSPSQGIFAVAKISGLTAASIAIPGTLLDKKQDEEEVKVVADHYGDLVKSLGKKKDSITKLYETDFLKKYRELPETNIALQPELGKNNMTNVYNNKIKNGKNSVPTNFASYSNVYKDLNKANTSENFSELSDRKNIPEPTVEQPKLYTTRNKTELSLMNKSKRSLHKAPRNLTPSPTANMTYNNMQNRAKPKENTPTPSSRENARRSPLSSPHYNKTHPTQIRNISEHSPIPPHRRPLLREIMTQTSVGLESFNNDSSLFSLERSKELKENAEVNVRSTIDYLTDLTMLMLAFWLYVFNNELLAIPVLLVMVYRQLQAEIVKRTPKWILKRLKRKKPTE